MLCCRFEALRDSQQLIRLILIGLGGNYFAGRFLVYRNAFWAGIGSFKMLFYLWYGNRG